MARSLLIRPIASACLAVAAALAVGLLGAADTEPAVEAGARVALAPERVPAGVPYRVIAHRGDPSRSPLRTENGYRAVRAAARIPGVRWSEVDVRPTRDGRLLVLHDAALARTTTCRGLVRARTRRWIREHCRLVDGGRVPFLAPLMARARRDDHRLLLELKRSRGWRPRAWRSLTDLLDRPRYDDRFAFLSASPVLLGRVARLLPGVPRVVVGRRGAPPPTVVRRQLHATGITLHVVALTAAVVDRYRAAGIEVYGRVYRDGSNSSTTTAADWDRFRALGLAGHLTDDPAGSAAWARGRG